MSEVSSYHAMLVAGIRSPKTEGNAVSAYSFCCCTGSNELRPHWQTLSMQRGIACMGKRWIRADCMACIQMCFTDVGRHERPKQKRHSQSGYNS